MQLLPPGRSMYDYDNTRLRYLETSGRFLFWTVGDDFSKQPWSTDGTLEGTQALLAPGFGDGTFVSWFWTGSRFAYFAMSFSPNPEPVVS